MWIGWRIVEPLLFRVLEIDGVKVAVANIDERPPIDKVTAALRLIEQHDPLRFARLKRDLTGGIRVDPAIASRARFIARSWVCEINYEFANSGCTIEVLAATIVHEAAHARLWRRGITYDEPIRARVEAICMRRELAFARRLPDGEKCFAEVKRALEYLDSNDYTEAAFANRNARHMWCLSRKLRRYGLPIWFIRVLRAVGQRNVSGRGRT